MTLRMAPGPRILFLYPGRSRAERLHGLSEGATPKDFWYGYLALADHGYDVGIADTRRDPSSASAKMLLFGERLQNRLTGLGFSRERVRVLVPEIATADIAISTTDGFSLSLGLYERYLTNRPVLVGGFHGLADMVDFAPTPLRQATLRKINHALRGLDHVFFFGDADRRRSVSIFDLDPAKTSLYPFGIDTDFWSPDPAVEDDDYLLSVGSDPRRDYATLLDAPIDAPLRIITRLAVRPPAHRKNIEVVRGSYYGQAMTDLMLRDMYRRAQMVVVPLRDVWQPTGYSVTLQAMACGKPVVLSNIKGLWDRHAFRSGENCLLVPPGDPEAIAGAVAALRGDATLRRRVGTAARQTALRHFQIDRMNRAIVDLVGKLSAKFLDAPLPEPTLRRVSL